MAGNCGGCGIDCNVQELLGDWRRMLEGLLAVERLLQDGTCLSNGREAVRLELGGAGSRAADNLVEGPNDVDYNMRAPEEEGSQLLGQPLCCWALSI